MLLAYTWWSRIKIQTKLLPHLWWRIKSVYTLELGVQHWCKQVRSGERSPWYWVYVYPLPWSSRPYSLLVHLARTVMTRGGGGWLTTTKCSLDSVRNLFFGGVLLWELCMAQISSRLFLNGPLWNDRPFSAFVDFTMWALLEHGRCLILLTSRIYQHDFANVVSWCELRNNKMTKATVD